MAKMLATKRALVAVTAAALAVVHAWFAERTAISCFRLVRQSKAHHRDASEADAEPPQSLSPRNGLG